MKNKKTTLQNKIENLFAVIFFFILLFQAHSSKSQNLDFNFPRIASFQWNGARPEWYSKYGLVIIWKNDALAAAIKRLNPTTKVLWTQDWNAGGPYIGNLPSQWLMYDSKGNMIYYNKKRNQPFANPTDFSLTVNGKRYNEALPQKLSEMTNFNIYDGISTDGVWLFPYGITDIDLDRNGINDFDEHGADWIANQFKQGFSKIIKTLRELIGNNLIFLNLGYSSGSVGQGYANGRLYEYWPIGPDWDNWFADYRRWNQNSYNNDPISIVFGRASNEKDYSNSAKNHFIFVRYTIGSALLGNGYVAIDGYPEHYWNNYYDEFDVSLGKATSSPQSLLCDSNGKNCVWVRFFKNGAVVVNTKSTAVTITDDELKVLDGYNGPYYRFKGGQQPDFNNGKVFDSVELFGGYSNSLKKNLGDAIILLKEQKTVVSDIIVDNAFSATSPGSHEAFFEGNWLDGIYPTDAKDPDKDNPSWTTGPSWNGDYATGYFRYRYARKGDGSDRARFIPTIGVTGNYEIFEWHGWAGKNLGDFKMADNVPCTIQYAGGKKVLAIDQSKNFGQWNSLGIFQFSKGKANEIVLSNYADGVVVADAFKFVYRGLNSKSDNVAPNPPTGLKVNK